MSHSDSQAEQAVIRHHAQLAAGLDQRVAALIDLAEGGSLHGADEAHRELLDYLAREIFPHAQAEEGSLYPPAAASQSGDLLIKGMIEEHHALTALAGELAEAASPVRAAAAGRALSALFASHLDKENRLVLPLLAGMPGVSLAQVLDGMHELLGSADAPGVAAQPEGCGCGGCGCGGDRPAGPAAAPVLSLDDRIDVREIPHSQRHALVLSAVAALSVGEAVVLVAPHAPRPLLAQIDERHGDQMRTQWLQSGPEIWQVRVERVAAPA